MGAACSVTNADCHSPCVCQSICRVASASPNAAKPAKVVGRRPSSSSNRFSFLACSRSRSTSLPMASSSSRVVLPSSVRKPGLASASSAARHCRSSAGVWLWAMSLANNSWFLAKVSFTWLSCARRKLSLVFVSDSSACASRGTSNSKRFTASSTSRAVAKRSLWKARRFSMSRTPRFSATKPSRSLAWALSRVSASSKNAAALGEPREQLAPELPAELRLELAAGGAADTPSAAGCAAGRARRRSASGSLPRTARGAARPSRRWR